jgi:predicted RND superfamily exporter protein
MGLVQRLLVKGVLRVVAHPKLTLGLSCLLLIIGVGSAKLWLHVSSDQNELFSPRVKFFHDWLDFNEKFPENQATYVVIEPAKLSEPPALSQWVAINEKITRRLQGMQDRVEQVVSQLPLNDPKAPALLFDDPRTLPEHFEQLQRFVPLIKLWGERPTALTGLLGGPPISRFISGVSVTTHDSDELKLVDAMAKGWREAALHPDRPPRVGREVPDLMTLWADSPEQVGYFYVPDADPKDPPHRLMLIRVYEKENHAGLTTAADTIDAIRNAVEEEAKPFTQQFKVGLTGRPVLDADEDRTTDRDGRRAEILALATVFLGLVVFLRSVRLAIIAEVSLAVAIGWTFGWATLSVHRLNLLSTVFLIALIGIGMDYLIQILAAYRREARRYVRPEAVWSRVFRYVGPPVNTACLGAAGAFLVSALTDFKGAAELGIIAGGGLLLCLLVGYTVLPALLVLFPAKLEPYPLSERYGRAPQRTRIRLLLPLVWVVALLAGIPFASKASFNPNLLDLQAPNLPSVQLIRKLQTWEAVVLSTDLGMLRRVNNAVIGAKTVAGTDSVLRAIDNREWLHTHAAQLPKIDWAEPIRIGPKDIATIAGKARGLADHLLPDAGSTTTRPSPEASEAAAALRAFAESITDAKADAGKITNALSVWQDTFVAEQKQLLAMLDPPPLEVQNIPTAIRQHLASDVGQPPGQYVYALYIEPKSDLWKRENLSQFMQEVEARVATVPGAPSVTGIASDIYHSTASIQQAFYHATAYALILIFILVLIDLRNITHTLIAVSVLALGLPMLVAIMGLIGASWNFANFFGLPILIGAGHEYGVFMMHRYREAIHNPRRVWRRWDPADRALLLCAFVTCSSFGFFWLMSSHLGLKSLGLVMAIGTLCIYLAAVIVVRSLLTWMLDRRAREAASGGFAVGDARRVEDEAANRP